MATYYYGMNWWGFSKFKSTTSIVEARKKLVDEMMKRSSDIHSYGQIYTGKPSMENRYPTYVIQFYGYTKDRNDVIQSDARGEHGWRSMGRVSPNGKLIGRR